MPVPTLRPIGRVTSSRTEPLDDAWDSVTATIELDAVQFTPESLAGLDEFSHLEILFLMDQVKDAEIEYASRHPRGRTDWPKVGIFAQRAKMRPNRLGSTVCQLERIDGRVLHLRGLDAIDGSPVLDIKPWVLEFGARGRVRQPLWITELMHGYWGPPAAFPQPDPGLRPLQATAQRRIASPPRALYLAWTQGFDRWFARSGSVEMRAAVGAPYFFETEFEGARYPHYGRFLCLEPARHLEMTWLTSATGGQETIVSVDFRPDPNGTCLELIHRGFADEPSRRRHEDAWPRVLENLDRVVAGGSAPA